MSQSTHSPEHFFYEMMLPAYFALGKELATDVLALKQDLSAFCNFAGVCLDLCDYLAEEPSLFALLPGNKSSTDYSRHVRQKYPAISLLQDVANACKHRKIDRRNPAISDIEQVKVHFPAIRFEDPAGYYFGSAKVIRIKVNDGKVFDGDRLAEDGLNEWVLELMAMGVLQKPYEIPPLRRRAFKRSELPEKNKVKFKHVELPVSGKMMILDYDRKHDCYVELQSKLGTHSFDVEVEILPKDAPTAT